MEVEYATWNASKIASVVIQPLRSHVKLHLEAILRRTEDPLPQFIDATSSRNIRGVR